MKTNLSFKRISSHTRYQVKKDAALFSVFTLLGIILFFILYYGLVITTDIASSLLVPDDIDFRKYLMTDNTNIVFSIISFLNIFNLFLTLIFASKNYFFLYSRRKVDFYHASPLSRKEFFISNVLSAAVMNAIFTAVQLILIFVFMRNEAFSVSICILASLVSFLSCVTAAAVISLCAVSEGTVLTFLVNLLTVFTIPLFSCVLLFDYISVAFPGVKFPDYLIGIFSLPIFIEKASLSVGLLLSAVFGKIVLIVLLCAFGAWLYEKRKSEKSGDLIISPFGAFAFASSTFTFCVLLSQHFFLHDTFPFVSFEYGRNLYLNYYVAIPCSLVAVILLTVIYLLKKEKKTAIRVLSSFAVFFVSMLIFFPSLEKGGEKYRNYIPNEQDIESVSFEFSPFFTHSDSEDFYKKMNKAQFTDASKIRQATEFHKECISSSLYDFNRKTAIEIEYRLKNGRKVKRLIPSSFESENAVTFFWEITESPEFMKFNSEEKEKAVMVHISFYNRPYQQSLLLKGNDAKAFIDAFNKDRDNGADNGLTSNYSCYITIYFEKHNVPDEIIEKMTEKELDYIKSSSYYFDTENYVLREDSTEVMSFIESKIAS